MRFRDDIDLDKTWVVSDTHFGHENIVGFCHRPEEHDQIMIAEWRAHVPDDATVLHLGDLSYKGNARFKHLVSKELTGERKLLVKGNHDRQGFKFYRDCGFKLARPFALGLNTFDGESLVAYTGGYDFIAADCDYVVSFAHYAWGPPEDEGEMPSNHWRIHGHIHNNGYVRDGFVPFLRNHINMSVEQTKYRPVNLRLLLEGAILGRLPSTPENESALAAEARQRSIALRTRGKPS
jgi:calcineurin-like phosphoesterase family protein